MKAIIVVGIMAKAKADMKAKSRAPPASCLYVKTSNTGRGALTVVNEKSVLSLAVLSTDSYIN
jgi:hypothetical protein